MRQLLRAGLVLVVAAIAGCGAGADRGVNKDLDRPEALSTAR